jgi:hypothetical protein
MSALSIQVPFPVFQDRDGQPLENGYIWIGQANLNPQTNPVVVYFDEALTIVAAQPLRTLNGYISRAGTPAQVYVDGVSFSILVQDSKGSMVYNFPDGTGISPDACGVIYNPPFTGAVPTPVCEKLEQTVSVMDFGAVGDGVTNDTAAFSAMFTYTNSSGAYWHIPAGTYIVNGASPIQIKTSGRCDGLIKIPKANTTCWFEIARDTAGTVVSTTGWDPLIRGKTQVGATNAANKYLFINSTEVVIDRIGAAAPYYKQEFIRCDNQGNMTTSLVNTYTSYANVTVTANTPSEPVQIDGLKVLRTGAGPVGLRGSIVVNRDNVILNQPEVRNEDPSVPLAFAIEVGYCADVTLNRPFANGLQYAGLGYGVSATTTIGLTVNDATMIDCRHGCSGAFNVDWTINGGNWHYGIDDHWGNRMIVNDAKIFAPQGGSAIGYAGYDISVNDCQQFGGRNFFAIRLDTPALGGVVSIKNTKVQSSDGSSTYYFFGFSSDDGSGPIVWPITVKPFLPDLIVIEDAQINVDVATISVARLGLLETAHTSWGTVIVRGAVRSEANIVPIFAIKNSTYSQDRTANLTVDGPIDCKNESVIYATATDGVATRAYNCRIEGVVSGSVRYSGYSVNTMRIADCSLASIVNDDAAAPWGNTLTTVSDTFMVGGVVSGNFRNIAFYNCTFTGTITQFPFDGVTNYATLVGNTRTVTQAAMPADIRNNVVSPFI